MALTKLNFGGSGQGAISTPTGGIVQTIQGVGSQQISQVNQN